MFDIEQKAQEIAGKIKAKQLFFANSRFVLATSGTGLPDWQTKQRIIQMEENLQT